MTSGVPSDNRLQRNVGLAICSMALLGFSQSANAGDAPEDSSALTEVVPIAILDAWRPSWTGSINKARRIMSDVLNSNEFSKYAAEDREAALREIDSALADYISWERMGKDVVSRYLLQSCGVPLLNKLAPYFSDPDTAASLPEDLRKQSESCWIDVRFYVDTSPMYATLEFGKHRLPPILARHGIDPNSR